MPHALFPMSGVIGGTTTAAVRQLIPGIEPGGALAGRDMKQALLIRDAWIEVIDLDLTPGDYNQFTGYLKLSQEESLNPGFLIGVAQVGARVLQIDATGHIVHGLDSSIYKIFHEQGSIWVPQFVGTYWAEQGDAAIRATMHLQYEVILIPWMEFMIRWDWLDNITDNDEQH